MHGYCKIFLQRSNHSKIPLQVFITKTIDLKGGELISATPSEHDSNAPYGHAGWTFNEVKDAIVVLTIENEL